MPRELPSLNSIRSFEAAARHENFSRAADELAVTQSAVSRQIQNLEAELGQQLFERNGPKLTLTQTGQAYLEVVQEGLGIIRRGTARIFRRSNDSVVTLSLLPSLITQWLVPRLATFRALNPRISLRLEASYALADFARATDIDAAVRFGRGPWPGVIAREILDDVVVLVCGPALASRLERPEDVLNERLLIEGPDRDFWDLWLGAAGIRERPRSMERVSDDTSVQIQTTLQGYGIALACGMLVADDIRRGRLACPFRIAVRSPVRHYFVCPPDRADDETLGIVSRWMRDEALATVAGMDAFWGPTIDP